MMTDRQGNALSGATAEAISSIRTSARDCIPSGLQSAPPPSISLKWRAVNRQALMGAALYVADLRRVVDRGAYGDAPDDSFAVGMLGVRRALGI